MKINKSNKKCKTESSSQNTLFCFWKWWLVVSQQTEASQSAVFARRSWLWALSSQLASLHPSALQCSSPLLQVPSTALHQVPYPHYCTVPSTMGPVLHCTGYPVPSAQYCIVPSTMGPVLHCTQYHVLSIALYPVHWFLSLYWKGTGLYKTKITWFWIIHEITVKNMFTNENS